MDTRIYDEDKSIQIEDEYSITTFDIDTVAGTYERHFSIKDDAFFVTEKYEYKVSSEPIGASIRLIESYTEPPLEYDVKDGVVMESEMKKHGVLRKNQIEELRKIVKWHRLEDGPLLYYILSLHPEIINESDFKRFLRQIEQRIKLGIANVESKVKEKDRTGLQIIDGKYGKQIWYPDLNDLSKSEASKKYAYVKKEFILPLFNEKSSDYSGITDNEFSGSTEILKTLTFFLERDEKIGNQTVRVPKNQPSNNYLKWALAISLVIIALYWGVWTAVGVTLFGAIIYALIKNQ